MSQKSKKKKPAAPVPSVSREKQAVPVTVQASNSVMRLSVDEFEPTAGAAPVPVWLFVLLMVFVYWGMIQLDRSAGGFNQLVYGPFQSYKQLADLQPKSGPEALIARGEIVYGQVCVACHQANGLGSPGQYPPLVGSEWAQGPANRVIRIPLHGLTGPITVKGQNWNAAMPAFGTTPPLDNDAALAAVLTYVRQAWGNKADPITPEQVKAVRAEAASRTTPWTSDELSKVQ
jgi:mono/diheme cytochrome c family protein